MSATVSSDEVMTVREAAAQLKVGYSTLRRVIGRKELRTTRVGGRVLVRRSELERYLERRTRAW